MVETYFKTTDGKFYTSEEEANKAQALIDEKEEQKKELANARKTRAEEIENKCRVLNDLVKMNKEEEKKLAEQHRQEEDVQRKEVNDLITEFTKDYGGYHKTFHNVEDFDLFDNLFFTPFKFWF